MHVLSSKVLAHFLRRQGRLAVAMQMACCSILVTFAFPIQAQTNGFPEFKPEAARVYWKALARVIRNQVGTNAEGYYCLARLQSQLGEKSDAERLARKALELEPARGDIALFRAEILVRQDRMQEAAACLREALKHDSKLKGGQRQLGMVLDRLGDRDGAREAFRLAVQTEPGDAGAWLLLGKSMLDQGKLKEAVVDLEKACQLEPNSANAYYPLFQAQTRLGNREAAQAALRKFRELKKIEKADNGVLTEVPEDDEAALRSFTASAHRSAALVLIREGNAAAAEEHLRQAIRIAPQEVDSYELLGHLYVARGMLAEARTNLEEVIRLRPKAAVYRVNLGTVLLQLGDYPAAITELKHALELDPKRPEALHNLARFYLSSRRQLPEALALAKRLVEVSPTAASYDLLAWAHFANGETNEAIAASAEAVKQEPQSAVYSNRLHRLRQLAGAQR